MKNINIIATKMYQVLSLQLTLEVAFLLADLAIPSWGRTLAVAFGIVLAGFGFSVFLISAASCRPFSTLQFIDLLIRLEAGCLEDLDMTDLGFGWGSYEKI